MAFRHTRTFRTIAASVLTALLYEMAAPLAAYALTGGPAQPEFSSFEPVATTDMVNPFTGQFTYNLPVINVPGPGGSGYALSLSYHSGTSPEEEASWVGSGWTLNPGAIVRNTRGFPDDYRGDQVKFWNKTDRNWTVTASLKGNLEAFSFDHVGAGLTAGIRYNNYKGFGYFQGVNLFWRGIANLGYSVSDGEGSYSFSVNPAALLNKIFPGGLEAVNAPADQYGPNYVMRKPAMNPKVASAVDGALRGVLPSYISFATNVRPTNITPYAGASFNVSGSLQTNLSFLPLGVEVGASGTYTYQENVASQSLPTYGYMYSALAGDDQMMDYTVERENPYTRRDMFLAIPFSGADYFSVTGEGIGGTFRSFHNHAGHFHLNKKSSGLGIFQAGAAASVGAENGFGVNVGIGNQTLDVGGWNGSTASAGYAFNNPTGPGEPYFFRMSNDLGGSVSYADNDAAGRASFNGGGLWGFQSYSPVINDPEVPDGAVSAIMNRGKRSGRATHIGYTTVGNMALTESVSRGFSPGNTSSHFNSYNRDPDSRNQAVAVKGFVVETGVRVGEFSMVRPDGMRYTFGLPVFSRKEKALQYGIKRVPGAVTTDRYLVRGHVVPDASTDIPVFGEERDPGYAASYLLTSVETPDYVDVFGDGPTADDYGGYTLFRYDRTAGSKFKVDENNRWGRKDVVDDNPWYRWRTPYNGLLYHANSMSDPLDDRASFMSGEREIYYLKTIETKTHIAVFVTDQGVTIGDTTIAGSGEKRKDSYEAVHHEWDVSGNFNATAAQTGFTQSSNKTRRLERIELYAKGTGGGKLGRLIQTVRFEYDYSTCKGLPNSFKANAIDPSAGKLTLRRVYTEYNGVVGARIAPYTFGYQYRKSTDYAPLPSEVKTKYSSIIGFADQLSESEQNPNYDAHNIDAWGSYQADGTTRYNNLKPWVSQVNDLTSFDPAAWQLKWIQLPSGGEIHVQYEQNSYCYVQDRAAHAMVSLAAESITNKYYLNTAGDLGIANGSQAQKKLADAISEWYRSNPSQKIYFKLLYPIVGGASSSNLCEYEYVSAYSDVKDVGVDATGLWIKLEGEQAGNPVGPVDVLNNFIRTSRNGIAGSACTFTSPFEDRREPVDNVFGLIGKIGQTFYNPIPNNSPEPAHSFIRIPLGTRGGPIVAKKGGGVRVKRLLTYDKGIESGAATLFGTEYRYTTTDGTSSGVATNEPAPIREENALVGYMALRRDQGWPERMVAGRDKEQFEGPIGESLLPAPSIGYARVVIKSIHDGKTSSGVSVNEYNTVRDYPFDRSYATDAVNGSAVDHTSIKEETDWAPMTTGVINYNRANVWASQGYRFVLTNMHGQPKKMAVCAQVSPISDSLADVAWQKFEYFEPGEKVRMLYGLEDYRYEYPGREMEVVFEGRSVEDVTVDGSVEVDAGIGITPPFPIPVLFPWATAFGSVSYNEERLRTHVTCKVVRYPVILKKTTSNRDGVVAVNENVAFDPATGTPSVTRSYDSYHGLALQQSPGGHNRVYQTYSIPAYTIYPAMGQKASNEGEYFKSGAGVAITKYGNSSTHTHWLAFNFSDVALSCRMSELFTPGDMVRVTKNVTDWWGSLLGDRLGIYYVDKVIGNQVFVTPTIWASPHQGTMTDVDVIIVRSGKTNNLNAVTESVTTYDTPKP